jgi:hypothetical protein
MLYIVILLREVTLSGAKKRTLRVPAIDRFQFHRAVQILKQRISECIRIHFDFSADLINMSQFLYCLPPALKHHTSSILS